jgi:hypothetical protein
MILEKVFDMTNIIQTQAIDTGILDQAEIALVDGVSKTGDLIQSYADALCQVFNRRDTEGNTLEAWFNLVGAEKKGIKARRASFVQRMIARGHVKEGTTDKPSATVDTYWQRVKIASGYVPSGRVSGGTDVDAKTLAELKTMINRIFKSEEDGVNCDASEYKGALMEVFEGLGGDVDTLGKNTKG